MQSFTPDVSDWFDRAFAEPTAVQARGWAEIQAGNHALLLAPTGSGKTLAAFLWGIDRVAAELSRETEPRPGVRVLYISPLKALAHDVERNLQAPLVGIRLAAQAAGRTPAEIRVDVRTGDTPQRERARQKRDPGEILVTTPESLFLLLGSQARETLRTVHTVIVDEIHAVAPTKRGAHLALTLERLAGQVEAGGQPEPQRIGLSATVRPPEEVAQFLGGPQRAVSIVDTTEPPRLSLTIAQPIADMPKPAVDVSLGAVPAASARASATADPADNDLLEDFGGPGEVDAGPKDAGIWPALYAEAESLVQAHTATILFVNSRSVCERLALKINEIAAAREGAASGVELVRAHHGSVSHDQRKLIEEALKRGTLRGIVATSSLELGIDMGSVDLVVLIESPGSVARGLQRVGRAGHEVGGTSRGVVFPKQRTDLLECAVIARRMLEGAVEPITVPQNALDVLAQQVVAHCVDAPRTVEEIERLVRRAAPYRSLSRAALTSVLDMLSGRYPSDEFADLRPRLSWDRALDTLKPRRGTPMLSRLNAGTIPDRGLFTVHHVAGGARVGELDEEMVHETRVGDVVLLGASSWRVAEISKDRVLVEPAPGEPGKLPFWRGEGPGRPIEIGRAIGALARDLAALDHEAAVEHVVRTTPLSEQAAKALVDHLDEQREHTGGALPTDEAITIERFRDELGDWRVVILTPFGSRIHAPWSLALQSALSAEAGFEVVTMYSDDGIVLTFAEGDALPELDAFVPDPEALEDLVTEQVGGSPMFGTTFRENAARALLLPRRMPGKRTPLWAQRLKAKSLLGAVQRFPDFPIVLETYRQCLRDIFDLPALAEVLRQIRSRAIRIDEVETTSASPFASALVFRYVAAFMYEYDAPLAERRAQALTLDRGLLRDLLGHTDLRELLDPDVLEGLEAELQRLVDDRRARDADELHDVLRTLGAQDEETLRLRCVEDPADWLTTLTKERRAVSLRIGGAQRWVAAQDVGVYVHALGCVPPGGLPAEFLDGGAAPMEFLLRRYARTHGPFTTEQVVTALCGPESVVTAALARLESDGVLTRGALRPGGKEGEDEWCDVEVLRRIKRRTLQKLRGRVAAVPDAAFVRFSLDWQGVTAPRGHGIEGLRAVLSQLEGMVLPWSVWTGVVFPSRVPDFGFEQLDMLCASGEMFWVGSGALGPKDGKVAFYRRESAALLLAEPEAGELPATQAALLGHLRNRGASFLRGMREAVAAAVAETLAASVDAELEHALQELIWSGLITNDTTAPLRAMQKPARRSGGGGKGRGIPGRRRVGGGSRSASAAGGRWSLVADVLDPDGLGAPTETECAHARASALLERYGVVSREMAQAAGLTGGFQSVYRVLDAMEEAGRARRGHFVEGLTGAQFATPGAIDRLRDIADDLATADDPAVQVVSAVDPANPWGSILPWPVGTPEDGESPSAEAPPAEAPDATARPKRIAGAWLVLRGGAPALYVSSNRRSLLTFGATRSDPAAVRDALLALNDLPGGKALVVEAIDGAPTAESPHREALESAGFVRDYRGWTLREVGPRA